MSKEPPVMSVIVPLHNAGRLIGRCLEAIRGQEGFGEGAIEVIVVDDGSSDGGADAASLCDQLIRMDQNRGAATARNRGAKEARADILVFVDADVFLGPAALSALFKVFDEHPDVSAAVGSYTTEPADTNPVSVYHNLFTRYHHDLSPLDIDWFWGAMGAVRKQAFNEVGGFDERYQGASAEDMELGRALARAGHRVRYCPEAQGAHAHRFTLAGMLSNDYKKAVLGTKLRLGSRLPQKAPGFANPRSMATLVLVPLLLIFCIAACFKSCAVLAIAAIIALLILINAPFYNFLKRHFAGPRMVWPILLHWIQSLAILAGAAAGVAGLIMGRPTYGRPGWI
ncbi:MAG TPA: glycosyltransferase [bacterium]|nr:glycosyltransferase [bacterium]